MEETSIGTILREAREARNLTVEQAAEMTSYRPEFIRAIEEDNFAIFPAEIYLKGTLRGYGNFLGLNGLELVDIYKAQIGNTTVDNVRTKGIREVDNVRIDYSLKQEPGVGTQTSFTFEEKKFPTKTCWITVVLIFLLGIIYLTMPYFFAQNNQVKNSTTIVSTDSFFDTAISKFKDASITLRNLFSDDDNKTTKHKEESKAKQTAQVKEEKLSKVVSKPDLPKKDPNAIAARYDKVVVEMTASGQCWIDVFADGKAVYSGMMTKNRYKIFEANKRITVKYGNISVIQVVVNGKPVNMRGEEGVAVRHYPK